MSPHLCICCSFLLRSPSLKGFLKFHFRRPRIRLVVTSASSNLPPLCFHMLAAAAPLAHSEEEEEEEEEEKSRRGRYSFISRAAGGPFCRCRSSPPLPPLSLSLSLPPSLFGGEKISSLETKMATAIKISPACARDHISSADNLFVPERGESSPKLILSPLKSNSFSACFWVGCQNGAQLLMQDIMNSKSSSQR